MLFTKSHKTSRVESRDRHANGDLKQQQLMYLVTNLWFCFRLSWFTNSEISSLLSKCMHPRLDFSMGDSQTYSNSVVGGSVLVSLPLCWNWFLNLFVMWLEKTLGTSSFLSEIAIQLQFIAQHIHLSANGHYRSS